MNAANHLDRVEGAAAVAAAMGRLDISQMELARRAKAAGHGLSQGQISDILAGRKMPGLESAKALSELLNIPAHAILPELAALMPRTSAAWDEIEPCPLNPRKLFSEQALDELAESILAEGIQTPLMVRRHPDFAGQYEIVAGERRWRAVGRLIEAARANPDFAMPIKLIDPCDDQRLLELAILENVARRDMTAWEEAQAFAALADTGLSAPQIAAKIGLNERTVQKRLRLVRDLCAEGKHYLTTDRLSVEFANVLATLPEIVQLRWVQRVALDNEFKTTDELKAAIAAWRNNDFRAPPPVPPQPTPTQPALLEEDPPPAFLRRAIVDAEALADRATPKPRLPLPGPSAADIARVGNEPSIAQTDPGNGELFRTLVDIIRRTTDYADPLTRDTLLVKVLDETWSASPLVDMIYAETGARISPGELWQMTTLAELVRTIIKRMPATLPASPEPTQPPARFMPKKFGDQGSDSEGRPYTVIGWPSDLVCVGSCRQGGRVLWLELVDPGTGQRVRLVPDQADIEDRA